MPVTVPPGAHPGPYEILAPFGAGGRGEVFRGRDTRLGREVAVKVLPGAYSKDPERLRRFEQEARAVALRNHPNILAIYDGKTLLLTEFGEGGGAGRWSVICGRLGSRTGNESSACGACTSRATKNPTSTPTFAISRISISSKGLDDALA